MIDDQNEHDINSVAGVLKLYFRGLENPLFPKERFLDFISTISKPHIVKNMKKHHFVRNSALLEGRLACIAHMEAI